MKAIVHSFENGNDLSLTVIFFETAVLKNMCRKYCCECYSIRKYSKKRLLEAWGKAECYETTLWELNLCTNEGSALSGIDNFKCNLWQTKREHTEQLKINSVFLKWHVYCLMISSTVCCTICICFYTATIINWNFWTVAINYF